MRRRRGVLAAGGWMALLACVAAPPARAGDDVPEAFAPLEDLVGGWKGTGIPAANRLKGWPEAHNWAWKFAKGTPVGMTVAIAGGKTLAKGQLAFDEKSGRYRLDGTDPTGKPVAFVGTLEDSGRGQALVLERDAPDGARERLTIKPNTNGVRYTMTVERKEPGAPQFARAIESGLTKEGESFAAGGAAANLPKCILTGGAGTMTVSHAGKTYYVCCTGCRDEFLADPESTIAKAAKKGRLDAGAGAAPRDEPAAPTTAEKAKPKAEEPAAKPSTKPAPKADPKARAASLLAQAQGLEKSGKAQAALAYYQQIVKDFPGTPQAKVAAERVKALGK